MPENKLPTEFISRMTDSLGRDSEAFFRCFDAPPERALLLNSLRGVTKSALPFELSDEPVPWEAHGFFYSDALRPGKHILHEAGAYYIQEPSAMAPARALFEDITESTSESEPTAFPELRVLDMCAAPGGKSVQLAMMMGGRGLLISNEIHPKRAGILSQNMERMGVTNSIITNEAPERLAMTLPAFFDRILVDAPCSGEGMFRKNPDAISEWSPEAVTRCALRQEEILDCAADMLLPGGRLVYSTCTWSDDEDEDIVEKFLNKHEDFYLLRQEKLYPHEIRGEGQFYALLGREGAASAHTHESTGSVALNKKALKNVQNIVSSLSELLSEIITEPESLLKRLGHGHLCPEALYINNDMIYILPPLYSASLSALRTLRRGLHTADIKKDRLEPAHSLSHALRPEDALILTKLDEAGARAYINGEMITLDDTVLSRGQKKYALAAYNGVSLGWGRLSGNRAKNLYPKGLRTML